MASAAVQAALITGGAGGIGMAFARALLSRGFRGVLLVDIDTRVHDAAGELQHEAGGAGGRVVGLVVDVTDAAALRGAFDTAVMEFGGLSVVCNNAGIATPLLDNIHQAVALNLTAVMVGTQLATEYMTRGGVVVNTASVAGLWPVDFSPVYAGTKAGVVHFTRSCAFLAEAYGVRVCALAPNFVDTAMVRHGMASDAGFEAMVQGQKGGLLKPEQVAEGLLMVLDRDDLSGAVLTVMAHAGVRVHPFAPPTGRGAPAARL